MISFTIPNGTYAGRAVSLTTVNVDRNFQESSQLSLFENNVGDYPLKEIAVNGINPVAKTFSFTIKVLTESSYLDIIKYFESLKGTTPITMTMEDASTKSMVITQWDSQYQDTNYSNISVSAELVY